MALLRTNGVPKMPPKQQTIDQMLENLGDISDLLEEIGKDVAASDTYRYYPAGTQKINSLSSFATADDHSKHKRFVLNSGLIDVMQTQWDSVNKNFNKPEGAVYGVLSDKIGDKFVVEKLSPVFPAYGTQGNDTEL